MHRLRIEMPLRGGGIPRERRGQNQPDIKNPIEVMTAAERDGSAGDGKEAELAAGVKIAAGISKLILAADGVGSFPERIRINGIA